MPSDNFNRADGPLGANWTATAAGLAIVSNQVGSTGGSSCYTGAGAISLDQYSQVTETTVGDNGPCVRSSNSVATFYLMDVGETAGQCHLYKAISNSFTQLNSTSHTFAANDVVLIQAVSTTITTEANGSQVQSITDSAIDGSSVGGPYPGIYSGGGGTMDDWSGDLVATGPIINTQPQPQTVWEGQTATFSVTATASGGALSYQWFLNGGSIGGATSSSYTTGTLTSATNNGDTYYCAVTDSNGTTNTQTVILTVLMVGAPCWITA